LVAGCSRIGMPGKGGEIGAGAKGVGVLGAEHPLADRQQVVARGAGLGAGGLNRKRSMRASPAGQARTARPSPERKAPTGRKRSSPNDDFGPCQPSV
jgi:hypothetical protein